MELSNRLQAVADLLSDGLVVADIGTDHGYIPIYLVESGKSPRAFAMDINGGPLARARENINSHQLSKEIEVRQSDGVKALQTGECEAVVVAGMGGALAVKIMTEGVAIFRSLKEFILQPQSELEKVRLFLYENGYDIIEEDMVLEDGKYYPMMKVVNAMQAVNGQAKQYNMAELRYGRKLLQKKHPVMKVFLKKEFNSKQVIVQKLQLEMTSGEANSHIQKRVLELKEEIDCIKFALNFYETEV